MANYYIALLLSVALISGCSGVQTDRPYQELGRAQHFFYFGPGYLIGIEKRMISEVSDLERDKDNINWPDEPVRIIKNSAYEDRFLQPKNKDEKFGTVTHGQLKVMLATQILESRQKKGGRDISYIYNVYNVYKEDSEKVGPKYS